MNGAPNLKSLIEISKDGEWGKSDYFAGSVQMAVIRGTDFEDVRLGNCETLPIRYVPMHISMTKKLKSQDIVIETAGGSKDRSTGRTLFIKDSVMDNHVPLICASFSRFLRIDPAKANPRYLYWLLQNMYQQGIMRKYNTQHTGVARFQWTSFSEKEPILLPARAIQDRASEILSCYEDLIELNARKIRVIELILKLIYDEWCIEFRFPGHEKVKMVDSDLGEIPEGWHPKPFGDIAEQIRESVHPDEVNPETPYVGLEHIPRKSIALSEWGNAREVESSKLTFRKGDILFGKIRPYFHKVAIAPTDGICSSDTIVIRPVSPEYYSLVLLCASSEKFVGHASQTSQGTKMPRANWDIMAKYPIAVPPAPVLSKFNEIGKDVISLILNSVYRNRTLALSRDLLLPKLVSGAIHISDLDNQNPKVEQ